MRDTERRANALAMAHIARALGDATFLDEAERAGPAFLITFTPAALRRMRRFSGFITRVQHNFLWEAFPWTIRSLQYYGASLETFVAYVPIAQRLRRAGATQEERIASFTHFLEQRLIEMPATACPGLGDIVRHERAMWTVRSTCVQAPPRRPAASRGRAPGYRPRHPVPVPRRPFSIASFHHDPLAAIDLLHRNPADRRPLVESGAAPRAHDVLYSLGQNSNEVTRIEIDAVAAFLLTQVDGKRGLAGIARAASRRAGMTIAAQTARTVLEFAAEHEIITFSRNSAAAPRMTHTCD